MPSRRLWSLTSTAIALALGDDFVFLLELGGGITECFFGFEFATAESATQPQISSSANSLAFERLSSFCWLRRFLPAK